MSPVFHGQIGADWGNDSGVEAKGSEAVGFVSPHHGVSPLYILQAVSTREFQTRILPS